MNGTVPLGRIAGVPVRAHWSLLVILALLTDALASGVLPATVTGASTSAYWLVGVLVAVAFLGSLLLHEVSHAVVARRHGIPVTGITLWMLGGFTALDDAPSDPSTDLRVALVGPLVSLGCGTAAIGVAWGLSAAGASRVVVAGFVWLAASNGLLAVFNLLPGAPLDGGRVLRALLWRRSGDQAAAEITAARVGRGTGMALIALGFVDTVAAADLAGGIWLMIVGWFLMSAATLELQTTTTRRALGTLRVRDVMETELLWLPVYQSASSAAGRALDTGSEWCPVCDMEGVAVGVVAVENLVNAAVRTPEPARVGDVMLALTPRITARPDDLLADAVLRAGPTMPIVAREDDRVVGIVTPRQTVRAVRRARLATAGAVVGQEARAATSLAARRTTTTGHGA